MVRQLILALFLWFIAQTGIALAQPATATVSGNLYNGSGGPLVNATIIFNTPQQTVSGNTIAATIVSTRTNASGAMSPISLVQNSIVQITINAGQVITGIVPGATAVNINQVLTGTVITGPSVQVNGTTVQSVTTVNFENGNGIDVTNPSAGNIKFDMDTATMPVIPVTKGGTGLTVGLSGGILGFTGPTTLASSVPLTSAMPVIGGGPGNTPTTGTRSGNTTQFVTTTGAQTSGQCVQIDANGNHVASGSGACGAGGGGFARIMVLR